MITATRVEVLKLLTELSETFPEIRLGQLVTNLSYLGRDFTNEAIWEIEDAELLVAARKMLTDSQVSDISTEPPLVRTKPAELHSTTAH